MRQAWYLTLTLVLTHLVSPVTPYSTVIQALERQCYYEDLKKGDKFSLTFQVSEGGTLDIDFYVLGPTQNHLHATERKSTDSLVFTAEMDGTYTYCYSNEKASVESKRIIWGTWVDSKEAQDKLRDGNDPLEKEVQLLKEAVTAVRNDQQYLVVRERAHRDTAESTNSRVVWWSIFQTAVLIAVCIWQVFYLKRFFEVKRTV